MNTSSQPKSNAHLSPQYRTGAKPDYSAMTTYVDAYNTALTRQRDLDRYRTAYSDRTNIYDNARTTQPSNYFGTHMIRYINPQQRFSPAGMDMENSRVISGEAFTKTFKSQYPQNLNFCAGT